MQTNYKKNTIIITSQYLKPVEAKWVDLSETSARCPSHWGRSAASHVTPVSRIDLSGMFYPHKHTVVQETLTLTEQIQQLYLNATIVQSNQTYCKHGPKSENKSNLNKTRRAETVKREQNVLGQAMVFNKIKKKV